MMRPVSLLILLLSMVATGVAGSHARAAAPAIDSIVICAGATTRLIHLDAQGRQTAAPHDCPDCAVPALAVWTAPTQVPTRTVPASDLAAPAAVRAVPLRTDARRSARAPPLSV